MEPLVRVPVGGEVPDVRQVRVLRGPQRGRRLRLLAAVQVPDHRPRRRARSSPASWPATSGRARRATRSTRSGATTAASSSRTASSSGTRADEFLLTAAEPNLAYFADLIGRRPGRRSRRSATSRHRSPSRARGRASCSRSSSRRSATLAFFGHRHGEDRRRRRCTVSRTGYTGDLGYEVWVDGRRRARGVGPAVGGVRRATASCRSGQSALLHAPHRGRPAAARRRLRTPAGSPGTTRTARRPIELGCGWMFRDLADDDRPFIGRAPSSASSPTRPRAGR